MGSSVIRNLAGFSGVHPLSRAGDGPTRANNHDGTYIRGWLALRGTEEDTVWRA